MTSRIAIVVVSLFASNAAVEKAGTGTLTVNVRTMSDKGVIRCALWSDAAGFPEDVMAPSVTRVRAPSVHNHAATCTFEGVGAGTFAIAVLHDLNDSDSLDKNRLGIPKEPLGFSNNARIRFRPPTFDEAKFTFDGTAKTLEVSVH